MHCKLQINTFNRATIHSLAWISRTLLCLGKPEPAVSAGEIDEMQFKANKWIFELTLFCHTALFCFRVSHDWLAAFPKPTVEHLHPLHTAIRQLWLEKGARTWISLFSSWFSFLAQLFLTFFHPTPPFHTACVFYVFIPKEAPSSHLPHQTLVGDWMVWRIDIGLIM